MKIYQTAEYRITSESQTAVEKAMRAFAARLKREFPKHLWWTARNSKNPLSYISIIVATDERADEVVSKSEATTQFVEALYPNVQGEVKWTDWRQIASTADLPPLT